MKRAFFLALAPLLLVACAGSPPANWAKGGALLDIPRARWVRGDLAVEVVPDGRVLVNGVHELSIDRGGRVVDQDAAAVALLERDGRVVGPDDKPLGFVGVWSASMPGEPTAWLALAPSGEVIRYGEDGVRSSMGAWVGGCSTSAVAHQACMLISHILGMKMKDQRPYYGGTPYGNSPMAPMTPGVGVGIGIGL